MIDAKNPFGFFKKDGSKYKPKTLTAEEHDEIHAVLTFVEDNGHVLARAMQEHVEWITWLASRNRAALKER